MRLVLVVEDDDSLVKILRVSLKKEGLRVVVAQNIKAATRLINQHKFDLVILDRLLPDEDGLDLVEELLDINHHTRVLVLTTRSGTTQRIKGFKLGVDEYLTKPFSHRELMLRVKSLLAKQKIYLPEVISCGDIVLFPKTCSLVIDGCWSKLRPRESQILACLIYHQGFVVTDEVLLDFVWGYTGNFPSHSSISVYIRRIRMALGSKSSQLKTIRGVGYRLS